MAYCGAADPAALFVWRRGRDRGQSPRRPMTAAQPPLTPEETLRRVLRTARLDGISLLVGSGLLAGASLLFGDLTGAGIGLLICTAGAVELRGRALLQAGQARGVGWLIASQVSLLSVVLVYVLWQLNSYNPELARELIQPVLRSALIEPLLAAAGLTEADMLREVRSIYLTAYMIAGVLSFGFQGGLALYYRNRRAAVTAALDDNPLGGTANGRQ